MKMNDQFVKICQTPSQRSLLLPISLQSHARRSCRERPCQGRGFTSVVTMVFSYAMYYAMYTMLSSCLAQEAENPSEALVANIHVPLQQLQELCFQKLKLLTCDVPRLCIEIDVEALWLLHPWAQVDKKLEISSYFIQICELILKKIGFKWSYPLVIKNSRTKIHTFPYDISYFTLIYPQTIAIFQCTDASFNYRGYPHKRHPVEDRCLRSDGHSC